MNWKYIKPLVSEQLISEFEKAVEYSFPKAFVETICKYNGARPEDKLFDTDVHKQRAIKSFLSFNKEDKESIWKIADWNQSELSDKYVAFAIDDFGNLICFNLHDNHIVFLNLETLHTEQITDSFTNFIDQLYSC